MGTSRRKQRYAKPWAHGVVDALCEAHPRATDLAFEITALDRESLASLLSEGDIRWELFKGIAKLCEPWVQRSTWSTDNDTKEAIKRAVRLQARADGKYYTFVGD